MADKKYYITIGMNRRLAIALTCRAAIEGVLPDELILTLLAEELADGEPDAPIGGDE